MAWIRFAQTSFSAGEITPRLFGRFDLDKYYQGCETMENMMCTHHGPSQRRWGTRYVAEVKSSANAVRLVPFVFSETQAYVFEFGPSYIRFYTSGGQIQSGGSAVEVATTYTAGELDALEFTTRGDILFITHPDHAPAQLVRSSDTSWTLSDIPFDPPPTEEPDGVNERDLGIALTLSSAGVGTGVTATLGSAGWLAADVGRTFNGPGGALAIIVGYTSTTVVTVDIINAFDSTTQEANTWYLLGTVNTTCTPAAAGPAGSRTTLTLGAAGWRSGDVGEFVHINDGICEIITFTSTTVVNVRIVRVLSSTTAASGGEWTLEYPIWSAAKGYPQAPTFHEGRLVLCASADHPRTLWASATGVYTDFGLGTAADESYSYELDSPRMNIIQWVENLDDLFFGTLGREIRATGGTGEAITPTNISVRLLTAYGSAQEQPNRAQNALLFINSHRNTIRELTFSVSDDTYVAEDLLLLSDHLTEGDAGTLQEATFAEEEIPSLWVTRSDGVLLQMVYLRRQDVVGWSRHIIGGTLSGADNPDVETITSIPHWTDPNDSVWMVVRRTINGATKRYIEYLDPALYTDCALTYSGAATASLTGLDHLEGETVTIVAKPQSTSNAAVHPSKTVASGAITLDYNVTNAEVGLPFTSTFKPVRPELPQTAQASMQGLPKRWAEMTIRLYKTVGIKVNGEAIAFREFTDEMDNGLPVFTGDKKINPAVIDEDGQVTITQDSPLPFTIVAIFGELMVEDDRRAFNPRRR